MAFDIKSNMINNIKAATSENDILEAKKLNKVEYISLDKLIPNPKNFYNLVDIDGLAEDILINGLNSSLIVRPIQKDKYELVGGHRRYTALKKLVDNGEKKFNIIPCVVKNLSDLDTEIVLIMDNAQTRELSELEKLEQVNRLQNLYKQKKKNGEKVGTIRKIIADNLKMSETQVQRYNSLDKLIPELDLLVKDEKLNISSASEFTSLSKESQLAIVEIVTQNEITKSEAENLKKQVKQIEKEVAEQKDIKEKELKLEYEAKITEMEKQKIDTAKENEVLKQNIETTINSEKEELKLEYEEKLEQVKNITVTEFEAKITEMENKYNKAISDKKLMDEKVKELENNKDDNGKINLENYKRNAILEKDLEDTLKSITAIVNSFENMKKNQFQISYNMNVYADSVVSKIGELKKISQELLKLGLLED